jgi:hypothetical protein
MSEEVTNKEIIIAAAVLTSIISFSVPAGVIIATTVLAVILSIPLSLAAILIKRIFFNKQNRSY